ncbi:Hypp5280 [Branchiostoma lanceolatum]|uniref:Hypp5280 protein n=1 Tax=Branchiostoma lanceolatum TaxID=7740 RepID=A0A8K0AFT8_BRALA|nr:Hypp5280 [Branchiostoma lanceolatum]
MTSHFALVLALTFLTVAVFPATGEWQDQQGNDEDSSPDIDQAEHLLRELEDLVEEEVLAEDNNVGDDDMVLLSPEKRHGQHNINIVINHGPNRPGRPGRPGQNRPGQGRPGYALPTNLNIALGRAAFQSSVGHGGTAGRAVDGNRRTHWNSASCIHTEAEDDPWWYVDLGKSVTVDHVSVIGRQDCCTDWLTPFDVLVGTSTHPHTIATRNRMCGGHHYYPPRVNEKVVHCRGLRGRYVFIRLPGKHRIISLCEVEVYAAPNLALGKPTVQSAVGHGGYASRATDGCRARHWDNRCCTATPAQSNPWLQVDLGKSTTVQWVVIVNRGDCCRERINPYTIHIGNDEHVDHNPRCGGHHSIPLSHEKNMDAINCNGLRGRYVGIRLPGNSRILTVCELEVYAGNIYSKRTPELRGTGCGTHKEGESWVSPDEGGHNCMCDIGEEICYKVDCGTDGKQQPIKNLDGLWDCPKQEEKEETAREFLDETMEDWMDHFEE